MKHFFPQVRYIISLKSLLIMITSFHHFLQHKQWLLLTLITFFTSHFSSSTSYNPLYIASHPPPPPPPPPLRQTRVSDGRLRAWQCKARQCNPPPSPPQPLTPRRAAGDKGTTTTAGEGKQCGGAAHQRKANKGSRRPSG